MGDQSQKAVNTFQVEGVDLLLCDLVWQNFSTEMFFKQLRQTGSQSGHLLCIKVLLHNTE